MVDRTGASIEVVFLATDFSATAALAERHAARLARSHRAGLVVAHVVEPITTVSDPMFIVPPGGGVELREFATAELDKRAEALRKKGLTVETRLGEGPPGPILIELAEQVQADVIVIGTRGLSGLEHLLFGSTAEHVVRRSRCPVLTVHPKDGEPREPVETVIVPTDLSIDAAHAVEAFSKVFDTGARPRVVLAFADPTPPYLDPFKHENLEKWHQPDLLRQEIDEQMSPIAIGLRDRGFEVETEVLDGSPVQAIVDLARERSADMIVMSTHGRSAIVNWLLGRTAQRIVQHAPCPVLTVRPPSRPAPAAEAADIAAAAATAG